MQRKGGKNRQLAAAAAALLTPLAVVAAVLAVWRIGADIGLTGAFAIQGGVFSHWQVWVGVACGLEVLAMGLNRYGGKEGGR